MSKMSRQNFKYLENQKNLKDEIKSIFIIFKGLSLKQIKQVFLEGESLPLICFYISYGSALAYSVSNIELILKNSLIS